MIPFILNLNSGLLVSGQPRVGNHSQCFEQKKHKNTWISLVPDKTNDFSWRMCPILCFAVVCLCLMFSNQPIVLHWFATSFCTFWIGNLNMVIHG